MKRSIVASSLVLALAACGGEAATAPPPPPAPPPPAATASATASSAVVTPAPKAPLADLEKKTLTDQWAAFNARDVKGVLAAYTPDAVIASPGPGGIKPGTVDDFRALHEMLAVAYPDLKMGISRVFVKGNTVAYEWTVTGTNTGEIMGHKATGKKIGVMAASVATFNDDGKIVKETNFIDGCTIQQQLGLMPGKPRALAELPKGDPQWMTAKGDDAEAKTLDAFKTKHWPANFAKDAKAYEATLDDGSAHYEIASPNDFVGKKALLAESDMYQKALDGVNVSIDDAFVVGNVVVAQFTFSASSMKGAIGPFKATKKPFKIHGVDFTEIKGDKLGKAYTYGSGMEMLDQVGALPPPPKDGAMAKGDAKGDAKADAKSGDAKKGDAPKPSDAPKADAKKADAPKK